MRWIPRFHHVILLLLVSMTVIMWKTNTHFKSSGSKQRIEAKRRAGEAVRPEPVDPDAIRRLNELEMKPFEDDSGRVRLQKPPPPEVVITQPTQLPAVSISKKTESGSKPQPKPEPDSEDE